MMEWRPVVGFPGYEISDQGDVRSLRRKPRILARRCGSRGYPQINMMLDGRWITKHVHRLVLEAFVGPCPDDHEAAHLDGNQENSTLGNLAWVTHRENALHRFRHGTQSAKLTEDDVAGIRERLARGESQTSIADELGLAKSTISAIARWEHWRHL